MTTKNLVHRIEDGMDRTEVYATTYQMRNFYRQMADGFFQPIDVMNYIQHHQIAKWAKKGTRILDVCCGRGLLLPLLRYHAKEVAHYVGVDIKPENAIFRDRRVTDGKPIPDEGYYPFPVDYLETDAAEMAGPLTERGWDFDLIVYTSAIEHMNRPVGLATLGQCREVVTPHGALVLTTPRTPDDKDGYDTQYRAHVYEWTRPELLQGLADTRWGVTAEWGIYASLSDIKAAAEPLGLRPLVDRLAEFVPVEWLLPVLAPMFPKVAKEIAFLCHPVA
jgi:2-polyprenyl-3-methyl-5-hydroxy-6-metoxy-1,4-benzoquinol methylase